MPTPTADANPKAPKDTALLVRMSAEEKATFAAAAKKGDTFAAELLRKGGLKEAAKILRKPTRKA